MTLTSRSGPRVGMALSKTLDLYLPSYNVNEMHQRVFIMKGLINFDAKTLTHESDGKMNE